MLVASSPSGTVGGSSSESEEAQGSVTLDPRGTLWRMETPSSCRLLWAFRMETVKVSAC